VQTRVTRTFSFEAAHQLEWHSGPCKNLHGHSYRLEVTVSGALDNNGIVIDFADLSAIVQREVIDAFDHTYLNDLLPNPTAELIAHDIWDRLSGAGAVLHRIVLWETENSRVEISA
jgi:6-pyruvoyltetrahydropterin/6-carboxytetrahydropterin synthase